MDNIKDWAKQYQEATFEEKVAKGKKEAARKALFSFIDKEHGEGKKGGIEDGGFVVIREVREKSEIDQEALIGLLLAKADADPEELALMNTEAEAILWGRGIKGVKFVAQVDEDAVQSMIESEEITAEELLAVTKITGTPAIRVKEVE